MSVYLFFTVSLNLRNAKTLCSLSCHNYIHLLVEDDALLEMLVSFFTCVSVSNIRSTSACHQGFGHQQDCDNNNSTAINISVPKGHYKTGIALNHPSATHLGLWAPCLLRVCVSKPTITFLSIQLSKNREFEWVDVGCDPQRTETHRHSHNSTYYSPQPQRPKQ